LPCIRAGSDDLKHHLQKYDAKPWWERLSDFHLLLYVSRRARLTRDNEIARLLAAIRNERDIPGEFIHVIDGLAKMYVNSEMFMTLKGFYDELTQH
jgi:hypothetical protein